MELLEFKNKILELFNIKELQQLGDSLMKSVLSNDDTIYQKYSGLCDGSKDYLQSLWQYYEADRTEKMQDYTPKSLCRLVSALAGDCKTVYDCCGGTGALTIQVMQDRQIESVFVEELDERVIPFLLFNLCYHNATGYVINGNALSKEHSKCYELTKGDKYSICKVVNEAAVKAVDVAVSNPPYNIRWFPPMKIIQDHRFPVDIPPSNANWAFAYNCFAQSNKTVLIFPCGALNDNPSLEARKYLVDNDLIDAVVLLPDKMFECTSISTCIVVLNKQKAHNGEICFIDNRLKYETENREQNGQYGGKSHTARTYKKEFKILTEQHIFNIVNTVIEQKQICEYSAIVSNAKVADNKYNLSPSMYIEYREEEQKHRDFQEIADNYNYILRMQNSCKLVINETIAKRLGLDIELYEKGKNNSQEIKQSLKPLGINIESEDYIQFTKNKNEFVFKCNDKEILPEMLIQFISVWKNQIALLNTMQNKYLEELKDALLPDLMSGKIEL